MITTPDHVVGSNQRIVARMCGKEMRDFDAHMGQSHLLEAEQEQGH
jgi:hypothetical protein